MCDAGLTTVESVLKSDCTIVRDIVKNSWQVKGKCEPEDKEVQRMKTLIRDSKTYLYKRMELGN